MHTQHSAAQREALRTSDTAVRLLPREAAIVEGDGIGNVNESVVVDLGSTDRHRELRNTTGGGVACTNLMAASTAQQDALVAVDDRVADSEVGAQLVVEVDGLHSWRAQECLLGVTDANEGVVDELAPCKPTTHGIAGEGDPARMGWYVHRSYPDATTIALSTTRLRRSLWWHRTLYGVRRRGDSGTHTHTQPHLHSTCRSARCWRTSGCCRSPACLV